MKNYYKIIVVDLSKQQALDTDTKAISQIKFILEEANKTVLEFLQGTVKVL